MWFGLVIHVEVIPQTAKTVVLVAWHDLSKKKNICVFLRCSLLPSAGGKLNLSSFASKHLKWHFYLKQKPWLLHKNVQFLLMVSKSGLPLPLLFIQILWNKQTDSWHLRPIEPEKHQNKSFGGPYDWLIQRTESVPMSLPLTRSMRALSTLDTVCDWRAFRYVRLLSWSSVVLPKLQ